MNAAFTDLAGNPRPEEALEQVRHLLYRLARLWPAPRRTRFVLVANPRSGTNWLRSLLNSHPRALMLGELFNHAYTSADPVLLRCPSDYLRWRMVKPYRKRPRAVGFKLLSTQLHPQPAFQALLDELAGDPTLRVLHLVREDRLAQAVSFVRASREGNWRERDYAHSQLELSPGECLDLMRRAVEADERLAARFRANPTFRLTYERLPEQLAPLLEFLQLPQAPLSSKLERQSSRTPREVLANYEALREALAGTEFSGHFSEGPAAGTA